MNLSGKVVPWLILKHGGFRQEEGTVVELRFEEGEARKMLKSAYKQYVQGIACSQTWWTVVLKQWCPDL